MRKTHVLLSKKYCIILGTQTIIQKKKEKYAKRKLHIHIIVLYENQISVYKRTSYRSNKKKKFPVIVVIN